MYPHLISVILRSEGAESLGLLSIAVSKPFPKFDNGAASAPTASALFVKNDRLEFVMISYLNVWVKATTRNWDRLPATGNWQPILPRSCFKKFLNLIFRNWQFVDMIIQPL